MHVNHVHEVSQILAQNATATNANKPVERLHLTNSEDQHVKMIAQQVERDEQHYNTQVQHIAAMRMMQQSSGMDMSSVINPAMSAILITMIGAIGISFTKIRVIYFSLIGNFVLILIIKE